MKNMKRFNTQNDIDLAPSYRPSPIQKVESPHFYRNPFAPCNKLGTIT